MFGSLSTELDSTRGIEILTIDHFSALTTLFLAISVVNFHFQISSYEAMFLLFKPKLMS